MVIRRIRMERRWIDPHFVSNSSNLPVTWLHQERQCRLIKVVISNIFAWNYEGYGVSCNLFCFGSFIEHGA